MGSDPGRVSLLANVASGRSGEAATIRLARMAEELPMEVSVSAIDGDDLTDEIRARVEAGDRLIAVAGGDGTLVSAANELAGTGVVLAPVPIGTLNHFCRRIGINRPEDGLQALRTGAARAFPVGVLDENIFLNTATIGIYAEIVRLREKLRPVLFKWPAAMVAFATLLVRHRRFHVVIQVDGEYLHRETSLVWIGVGWGSFPRVHQSPEQRRSPDLEIVIVKATTRLSVLVLLARLIRGLYRRDRPLSDPALEIFHSRRLVVHAAHRVGVTIDGEISYRDPPIFLAVQDDGLLVQVPAEHSD